MKPAVKILHAALLGKYEPGICRQMTDELEASRLEGLDFDTVVYLPCNDEVLPSYLPPVKCLVRMRYVYSSGWVGRRLYAWLMLRIRYFFALRRRLKDADLLLLRYSVADPIQSLFLLLYGRRTLTVHHTLEIDELKTLKDSMAPLRLLVERMLVCINHRLVRGVVGVTGEIVDDQVTNACGKGLRTFIYPNGVLLDSSLTEDRPARVGGIEMLFVASNFRPWQGLDLLLDAAANSHDEFTIHLVGELDGQQMMQASCDDRVRVHGVLSKQEIEKLISRCDLGLTGLALSRKGMRQACSLKVREYLSNGLPVYSGHEDVFPSDFPYYQCGNVSMEKILEYARNIRSVSPVSIRAAAENYINKRTLVRDLYLSLSKDFSQSI